MLTECCFFSRIAQLSSFSKCKYLPLFQKVDKPGVCKLAINEADRFLPQLMLLKKWFYDTNETSSWVNCPDKNLIVDSNFVDPIGSLTESRLAGFNEQHCEEVWTDLQWRMLVMQSSGV